MSRFTFYAAAALWATLATALALARPELLPAPDAPSERPKSILRIMREALPPKETVPETNGVTLGLLPPTSPLLDAVQKAGVGWARVELSWHPEQAPDIPAYLLLAQELKRRKINPLVALIDRSGGQKGFAEFAGTAAEQLRKEIDHWEIVIPGTGPGGVSAQDYAAQAASAANAIRSVQKKAVILSGPEGGVDIPYIQVALVSGLGEVVDGVSVRPNLAEAPETWRDGLSDLRERMVTYVPRKALQTWVTGWGYPAAEGNDQQARYLVREMLFNYGRNVPLTIWPALVPGDTEEAGSGMALLQGKDLTPTPSMRALEFMNTYLQGRKLKRRRELPYPMHGLTLTGRGGTVNVLWTERGEAEIKARPRGGPREGLPAYDLYGTPLPAVKGPETTLKITESPVYIEGRLEIVGFGE